MVENAVGTFGFPLGIATNFLVNGRDVLVPMAIEEPSVVAGASFAAKLAREGGGFTCSSSEPLMISQIQILDLADPHAARLDVLANQSAAAGNRAATLIRCSSKRAAGRGTLKRA